jgi:hypothetical protein
MALNLQDNRRPVRQLSGVNLTDRRRSDRNWIDPGEHFIEWPPEFGFDRCPDTLEGLRRNAVLQQLEFRDVSRWKQVRPHREYLPEFDEGRTEFFKGQAKVDRPRMTRGIAARIGRSLQSRDISTNTTTEIDRTDETA